ncbi:MAG: hypothetical protein WC140_07850 [Bacteroidales bacterium]|jgi:hypothetical protein
MADAAFTAGQNLTAAALNDQFNQIRTRRQQVTQTVNNSTTLVNSTYLTLSVKANTNYIFEALILYTADALADFKFNIALPTGSTLRMATWTNLTSGTALDSPIAHDAITTQPWPMGGVTGVTMSSRPTGAITIGGTAGNCTIQFAQNAAHASNCDLNSQSWMRLTEVA